MEKKWYQSSYYRTLLDMHIEDWDASFLSEFDPDYYVEQVKKAADRRRYDLMCRPTPAFATGLPKAA